MVAPQQPGYPQPGYQQAPPAAVPQGKLPTQVLGRRTVAVILDGIIVAAIIFGAAKLNGDLHTNNSKVTIGNAGIYYGIGFEILFNATIGKFITGIRVRERDGGRAGFIRVIVRNILRPIDGFLGYLVGWAVAMISGKHRRGRLGDLLGGTYVIRKR